MKATPRTVLRMASALLFGLLARAQAPLEKPLADFDKLVSQLKAGSVVGEPIRAGDTTVVPFARIKFGLGSGEAVMGFGGGMGGQTVPLGILIVEGDDVRAELFPEQEGKPSVVEDLARAILERKVVVMVNGLNVGNASGTIQEMAPLIAAMMGQTTVMVNGLNLGNLAKPASAAPSASNASLSELRKLFEAKKYVDALAMADIIVGKEANNAEAHAWKGRVMGSLALGNPADLMKYGPGAMQEFDKALALDANNPEAHVGRGIGRLKAPPGLGGNVDGAIEDFEAAIARKPSPEAYYNLGEALTRKGSKDKATTAYKKALELQPNFPDASKALASMK